MNSFWIFVSILLAMFVILVVIPHATNIPLIVQAYPVYQSQPAPVPSKEDVEDFLEVSRSQRMLDTHFKEAEDTVPVDFPPKPIGVCPHSKPQSFDLPVADIPMCVAASSGSMRLEI